MEFESIRMLSFVFSNTVLSKIKFFDFFKQKLNYTFSNSNINKRLKFTTNVAGDSVLVSFKNPSSIRVLMDFKFDFFVETTFSVSSGGIKILTADFQSAEAHPEYNWNSTGVKHIYSGVKMHFPVTP